MVAMKSPITWQENAEYLYRKETDIARIIAYAINIFSILILYAIILDTELKVSYYKIFLMYLIIIYFILVSFIAKNKNMPLIASSIKSTILGVALTIPILISTYIAASFDLPLMDHTLSRWDRLIGFNWVSFIHFADFSSNSAILLEGSYTSFSIQLLLIPIFLCTIGKAKHAYLMIIAFGLLCFICSTVSIWFPALGTFTTYGIHQSDLRNLNAYYGFEFLHDFLAVRSQPHFTLSITRASGIITFPSVHAGVAVLCAWAAWEIGYARWPLLALNIFMTVSAIAVANHYLVDIIAGMLISALSIACAKMLVEHIGRTSGRNGCRPADAASGR